MMETSYSTPINPSTPPLPSGLPKLTNKDATPIKPTSKTMETSVSTTTTELVSGNPTPLEEEETLTV